MADTYKINVINADTGEVVKTLEAAFAPAQPAAEASRFGSPALQAMIVARCVEKDQADSGFDYKTAADFLSGKTVSDEALRKFVAASRGAHDARAALHARMLSLQGELASREAEIALLKRSLLDAEAAPQPSPTTKAAPQPAPAPLSDDVVKDAARWRMAALIGNEVMLHPDKRTHATAVKAYMDATHSGSDLTGAVDAALAAHGGK